MRELIAIGILFLMGFPNFLNAQSEGNEKNKEISLERERYDYNPEGRRDPFRDLLNIRKQMRKGRRSGVMGIRGVYTDELVLVGITRKKNGKHYAMVLDSRNFPYTVTVGTKLADGEIIKITDNEVIIRQMTKSPVFLKPYKEIVLKLNMEEE